MAGEARPWHMPEVPGKWKVLRGDERTALPNWTGAWTIITTYEELELAIRTGRAAGFVGAGLREQTERVGEGGPFCELVFERTHPITSVIVVFRYRPKPGERRLRFRLLVRDDHFVDWREYEPDRVHDGWPTERRRLAIGHYGEGNVWVVPELEQV